MVYFRIGIMVLFLPWVSACASLAISGLTMGAGYSLMNKADKTTNYSMNKVFGATMLALNKMGIKISDTTRSAKVTKINAATESLGIAIELEKITLKTTKIGVEARKEMFLKDKSTAEEIIQQIQKIIIQFSFPQGKSLNLEERPMDLVAEENWPSVASSFSPVVYKI